MNIKKIVGYIAVAIAVASLLKGNFTIFAIALGVFWLIFNSNNDDD